MLGPVADVFAGCSRGSSHQGYLSGPDEHEGLQVAKNRAARTAEDGEERDNEQHPPAIQSNGL